MAKLKLLPITLIIFSRFCPSSPLTLEAVFKAAETLSNSGLISMALTLKLVWQNLVPEPPSATIFSPSDAAFADSSQPTLSLVKYHFSPLSLSFESLRSLPLGAKIPTMLAGHSLSVTKLVSDDQISLNDVKINGSPIYDDGSLIIFGVEKFFDLNFSVLAPVQSPSPDAVGCILEMKNPTSSSGESSFAEATRMLRSSGLSVMASFLDMQLLGLLHDQPKLTVFSPDDEMMIKYVGRSTKYSLLFLRHVVPCKLTWIDLVNFEDGTVFRSFLEGFVLHVTRSGDVWKVNGASIIFPDMYRSDWLVVHGINDILTLPVTPAELEVSPSHAERIALDRTEF